MKASRRAVGLMLVGALASLASNGGRHDFIFETGFGREDFDTAADPCDEGFDALCVTTWLDGELVVADSIEVQDADKQVIEDLTNGRSSSCSDSLDGGSWVVVATLDGETVAELVAVPEYERCPEETTSVKIDFEGAE